MGQPEVDPIASALGMDSPPPQAQQAQPQPEEDPIAQALNPTPSPVVKALAEAPQKQENPNSSGTFLEGAGNVLKDPGRGAISKVLTAATEGEQFIARGATSLLAGVGAMDPKEASQLLHQDEVHGHDIVNYFWKHGGGDDGSDPSRMSEGIVKFGAGLAADIFMDPLSYIGVGEVTEGLRSAKVAGETISGLEKMSQGEQAIVRSAQKIEKILKTDGSVVSVGDLTKDAAQQTNMKLLGDFANKQIGSEDLFQGLQGLAKDKKAGVDIAADVRSAHADALNEKWFDRWATGDKGLELGVHVPFTNMAVSYEIPKSSELLNITGSKVSQYLETAAKAGIIDNKLTRGIGQIYSSIWTKTGAPVYDAMKNKVLGLRNASEDSANAFMKEYYEKINDPKDLERLSFLTEYYVPNPEEKANFWADRTGQEHYDKEFGKLAEKHGFDPKEGLTPDVDSEAFSDDHTKLLQSTIDLKAQEKDKLLKKFTFDPAEVQKRFPKFTGISDTEMDFLTRYHAENDARIEEMAKRPGLNFEQWDPRDPKAANSYLMHKLTDEFFDSKRRTHDAVGSLWDELSSKGLLVDRNNLGREYRGYSYDANLKTAGDTATVGVGGAKGDDGIKKFIDDPIYLAAQRFKAMDRDMRNYDLMDVAGEHAQILAKDEQRPLGYVLAKKEHFGGVDEGKIGTIKPEDSVTKSTDGTIWRRFVPPSWVKNQGNMYLPQAMYDNLINTVNPKQYNNFTQALLDTNDKFMRVFRNTALFGPGYLGMKMSSDLLTYMTAGHCDDAATSLVDAVKAIHPKLGMSEDQFFHYFGPSGEALQASRRDVFQMMVENNVIKSSMFTQDFGDIAENIASTKQARGGVWNTTKEVFDVANLWKANRAVTKFAEDIPKAALFLDRLKGGFTPEAAAEAAERAFGSFNNQNVGAKMISRVMPFSSVAIKTLEGTMSRVALGEFSHLTVPGKVQSALQGAFVPDKDTRTAISQQLPLYLREGTDRIQGPLLPGQEQVLIEVPWVLNTLHFFLSPHDQVHPILKMIGAWATSKDAQEYDSVTPLEQNARTVGQTIGKFIPSWLKNTLAVQELNGHINMGGAMSKGLLGQVGEAAVGLDRLDVRVPHDEERQKALAQNFYNQVDFGKYTQKQGGSDWLYNMVFDHLNPDTSSSSEAYALAQRGNFIKQHFRDLTLGYATLTDMDKNVAINMGAMKRQAQKLQSAYEDEITRQGMIPNTAMSPEEKQEAARNNPKLKQSLDIKAKMEALHDYYDWYVGVEQKYKDIGPWNFVFGHQDFSEARKFIKNKPLPPLKQLMSLPAQQDEGANQ